jgi:hypothetical protein
MTLRPLELAPQAGSRQLFRGNVWRSSKICSSRAQVAHGGVGEIARTVFGLDTLRPDGMRRVLHLLPNIVLLSIHQMFALGFPLHRKLLH